MIRAGAITYDAPKPVRRRRRRLLVLLTIVVFVAGKFGYDYFQACGHEAALLAAIAETDRLDPGWRLEGLEAKRADVPGEMDSAPLVTKVGKNAIAILNKGTVRKDLWDISKELDRLSATTQLTPQQTETVRVCLAPLAGPLADARKIADFPQGRFPFSSSPEQFQSMPHIDNATITIWLLRNYAMMRAQDGDLDEAWATCQAILNVARSFGDEPGWVQTSRVLDCVKAIRTMERTLAQGQVREQALAQTQVVLKDEARHPALLIGLRGGRAYMHYSYTQFQAGKFSQASERRFNGPGGYHLYAFFDGVQDHLSRPQIRPTHTRLLRFYTQAVAIVKDRGDEVVPALRELQARTREALDTSDPYFTLDRFLSFLNPENVQAELDCARTALAVERFRLKHNVWPRMLTELVPSFLSEIPNDPYDGKPLRYGPTKDGVVVYSVGPNRDAVGDAWDRNAPVGDDRRLEFRLWNVDKRRRSP